MRLRAFVLLLCAMCLSRCGEQFSGRYGQTQFGSNVPTSLGAYTPGSSGTRQAAALLLPLTGSRADLGQVMLQAARLALPDGGSPSLDVLDTGGTPAGAVTAVQTALTNGDSLILGPLTSTETAAVAPIARRSNIPVLAFTNDASQSHPGIWPLGISPDQQVRRLVTAAQGRGKTQLAGLLPDTIFGQAMAAALRRAAEANALQPPQIQMHSPGMASITSAARTLADYANRRGPIETKIKMARALGTAEGRREAQELAKTPIPPPPFDVLLLADTGDALQEVAAILPYYDIDRSVVQLVGPALWADSSSGSAAVTGSWYAAPDNSTRGDLEHAYSARFGASPPPLADLAYDLASVAKVVLASGDTEMTNLTQTAGFVGTDGWFSLLPDGQVRRGLAVFRIGRGGPEMLEPAPQPVGSPGL